MKFIDLLKKIPNDFGQAEMREKTKGKLIGFEFIPFCKNKKALDIGCRDGYWSKRLIKKGYVVKSIDIKPKYRPAKVVDVNNRLSYKSNSFDVIWCSEVIEHLKNPKRAIKEMIRIIRPSGTIVLTTPNSYFWLMRIFALFGMTSKKIQNPGHLHFFDLKSLKSVLPKNSKIYGYFPYFLLKRRIYSFIGLLSPTFVIIIKGSKVL